MIIRYGNEADIPALIVIELSASTLFEGTHMAWAVGETSTSRQFVKAIAVSNLWVAEDTSGPAGYLRGDTLGDSFYIDEVSVASSYHRRGIGRQLIETALAEAARRGFRAATLTTDRTIPWNAPYYERLGFSRLTSREMPPALARRLANQPHREQRCVMRRMLG